MPEKMNDQRRIRGPKELEAAGLEGPARLRRLHDFVPRPPSEEMLKEELAYWKISLHRKDLIGERYRARARSMFPGSLMESPQYVTALTRTRSRQWSREAEIAHALDLAFCLGLEPGRGALAEEAQGDLERLLKEDADFFLYFWARRLPARVVGMSRQRGRAPALGAGPGPDRAAAAGALWAGALAHALSMPGGARLWTAACYARKVLRYAKRAERLRLEECPPDTLLPGARKPFVRHRAGLGGRGLCGEPLARFEPKPSGRDPVRCTQCLYTARRDRKLLRFS